MESKEKIDGGERKRYRVLMLGLDKAGKTSLLFKLKNGEVLSTSPTIGYHEEVIKYENEDFAMLDIGGSPQLRKVWSKYYDNKNDTTHATYHFAYGVYMSQLIRYERASFTYDDFLARENMMTKRIFFVIDAFDKTRIDDAKIELQKLLLEDCLRGVPIVILCNKQDKEDVLRSEDLKQALDLRDDHPCIVICSSAVTGEGLEEALKLLLFGMKVHIRTKT